MKTNFKVGDKVKVIKGSIGRGTIGKITEIDPTFHYPYKVKFKKGQGHGHEWMWFAADELELVPAETKPNKKKREIDAEKTGAEPQSKEK